jgi:hypothetical protein
MLKRLLNIGFVSSVIIIVFHVLIGFIKLFGFIHILSNLYIKYFILGLSSCLYLLVFLILWRLLVKIYNQSQLNLLLKSIIIISVLIDLIEILRFIPISQKIAFVLSIIVFVLYLIFINYLSEIDKSEVPEIEQLKNYSLAFLLSLFSFLILAVLEVVFKIKNLHFLIDFIYAIPFVFIGLFFKNTKQNIKQGK